MTELTGHYHTGLVVVSILTAMASAYVALSLVPRIHDAASSRLRALFWTLVFGVSMGAGIWTMHFIAMLAFTLPIPVRYDPWGTVGSMLEAMGFATLTAADGEEGVAVYREHRDEIVAVLLDMTMPKQDGKGCFRELRRVNPDVRVILSSGYNEQEATSRFAGQGLAGFIQKPYSPEALRQVLRQVLGRAAS